MNLDFVFICQSGDLEIKASLLAASIRRFCGPKSHIHVIEPSPPEVYGQVTTTVKEFLEKLGATWYSFTNPISDDYKIGNKLNAFKIKAKGDRIIFLDSDTVFYKKFKNFEKYFGKDFAAKGADGQTFDSIVRPGWNWNNVYDLFSIPYPSMKWPGQITDEWGPPYFNAGVLVANPELDLSTQWIEICKNIRDCDIITNKYPWLDQVALPIAILKNDIDYQLLSDAFNFPLRYKTISDGKRPFIIHYHESKFILQSSPVYKLITDLVTDFNISNIVSLHKSWGLYGNKPYISIKKQPAPPKEIKKDFFITGIPRSGTSLLCSLLDNLPNMVILNEPPEVFRDFRHLQFKEMFDTTINKWREHILSGKTVKNKLSGGNVNANTFANDGSNPNGMKYDDYIPHIEDENFALGIKNPLVFLTRLNDIRKAYPQALIINMVRHPYYTIGSWIRTFSHLREVWLHGQFLHGFNSPILNDVEKLKLMSVMTIRSHIARTSQITKTLMHC